MRFRGVEVAVLLLHLCTACASGGLHESRPSTSESTRPSNPRNVLTGVEIRERAPGTVNAADAIRTLRNTWISRPVGTRSLQGATPIRIYVNNVQVSNNASDIILDIDAVEALRPYPVESVYELRYYSPMTATQRWGTGNAGGAIELITGTPGVGPDTGGQPTVTTRDQAPSPFLPFTPGLAYFVSGGRAVVTRPEELSQVWEPTVSFGVGLGLRAARTVTLFGTVEVNRLGFSREGTVAYFTSRERGRLTTTDGIEVVGEPSTILNISIDLRVHPRRGVLRPYLVGGIGYSRLTAGAFRLSGPGGAPLPREQFGMQIAEGGDQTENGFSLAGGAGLEIVPPGPFRVFVDGRYVTALRGPRYRDAYDRFQLFNTTYYPVRIGLSYQ